MIYQNDSLRYYEITKCAVFFIYLDFLFDSLLQGGGYPLIQPHKRLMCNTPLYNNKKA